MSFQSYRKESRVDYGTYQEHALTTEQLRTGALLRIADAVETMAKSYDAMRSGRDWWKGEAERRQEEVVGLRHTIRGLRGALTKAKRGNA